MLAHKVPNIRSINLEDNRDSIPSIYNMRRKDVEARLEKISVFDYIMINTRYKGNDGKSNI